jgi:hypothetical protein
MLRIKTVQAHTSRYGKRPPCLPFSRIYLTSKDEKDLCKQLFRYAVELPIKEDLLEYLKEILEIEKDPDVEELPTYLGGTALIPIHIEMTTTDSGVQYTVPTPFMQSLRSASSDPEIVKILQTISLRTPRRTFKPPCTLCKKHPEHLAGDCTLLSKECKNTAEWRVPATYQDVEKDGEVRKVEKEAKVKHG